MDDDEIESKYIEIPENRGGGAHLQLTCGKAAFARLRDLVCADAKLQDINAAKIHDVWVTEVRPPVPQRKMRIRDYIPIVGCSLVLGLLFAVFMIGIFTIVNWGWSR